MLKGKLLFVLFFFCSKFIFAQNCDCQKNYQWVKKVFEENDAGFKQILDKKGVDAYSYHNKMIEGRISTIQDYDSCQKALEDWVKFFRTGHFRFTKTPATLEKLKKAKQYSPKRLDHKLELLSFKQTRQNNTVTGIEGIWESKDFKIAIQYANGRYLGSIIEDHLNWKQGDILFDLDSTKQSGTRYMSGYRSVPIDKALFLGDNLLVVNNLVLKRSYPQSDLKSNELEYFRMKNSGETFGYKRDEKTMYVRIPSFTNNKKVIDSVLNSLDAEIRSTPNLIIDLRDCQGGQDNNFAKLLPYLNTGTTRTVLAEVLSTPKNNEVWSQLINDPDSGPEEKETYTAIQNLLNQHLGEFVNIFGQEVAESKTTAILPFPKNVSLIIHENNFSTTEQFILLAKQSRKVKTFGRKTGGALDVSNMIEAASPTGDFIFEYCISRSLRIPGMEVDDMGIHPDFYLDKSIAEHQWVDFVNKRLEEWN